LKNTTFNLAQKKPVRSRFDEFDLDEANARLLRNGKAVALEPKPFSLLCELVRQPSALLTKDKLLDAVWGHQFVSESVLKTAISDLRKALGDNPREPRFIETVSRRGYRFIALLSADSAVPVTSAEPRPRPSSSFIGRTREAGRLRRAWDQARQGQRSIIWVAGEPGIGKTTLIEHFVEGLGEIVYARGQCVEHYGQGESYLPVLEALAMLSRDDPALPALLRTVAPTWLLQLPWLSTVEERDALRRELAGVGPDRMLREMGELLDRYTEKRPLLLVTEDLHWSDRATIQLIDHVSRRRTNACLMWLASFRVAEVVAMDHPLNALRRELRMHRLCEEVVLDPFSETEVADYVARLTPSLAREEAFVRALHERTDGVPLFISSIITDVIEQKDDDADLEARIAAVSVPENLAAIIDHYIARLGSAQRALLEMAAVYGVEFRADMLALASGRDIASVVQTCDELVRGHLWLAAPRNHVVRRGDAPELPYSFKHALFRQLLYERTPALARAQMHREVGTALERQRSAGMVVAASELAMHFDRGRQPMAALRYYAEAAETALLQFNPATCMKVAEHAGTLVPQAPPGAERDALEITLATLEGMAAFQSTGVGSQAKAAFERAYALLAGSPGHRMRGRLLHGFGYISSLRGEYGQALAVAERTEALASESDDQVLMLVACFLHGGARHLQGQTQASRSWMERGLAIAETLDTTVNGLFSADPQVPILGMLAIDFVRCGLVQQGRALVQRAHVRAADLRQPMTRLVAFWQEALLEVRLGNVNRLSAVADEMQALVEEFSLAHGLTASQWFRGWAYARGGRPREGHQLIREAYEQNIRLGMRAGTSEVLGYAAEALLLAGDVEGAQAGLGEALHIADALGERVYLPQLLLLEAAIARGEGNANADAHAVRRAIEEARTQQASWLELLALVELCEHHSVTPEENQALSAIVGQLPEAADTALARRAQALVARVKPD